MALKIDPSNTIDIVVTPSNTRHGVISGFKNTLYVAAETSSELYEIDTAVFTTINTIPLSDRPRIGVYNSSNHCVYFSAFASLIYKINPFNDVTEILIGGEERAIYGAYNPADNLTYFLSNSIDAIYIIDSSDNVVTLMLDSFPSGIFYNPADQKIYVGTGDGFLIISNGVIEKQVPGNRLYFPGLDPVRNLVFFESFNPDGIYFYGSSGISVSTNINFINREIKSGSFRVECLKIISTDIEQFGLPLQLIRKTLTGRTGVESIFPADYFGSFFTSNVVQLTCKELNNFVASECNFIRFTVRANSTLSLLFEGKLHKPLDDLKKKLRRQQPDPVVEEVEIVEIERKIPQQKPSDFQVEINNTGPTEIVIIIFSHFYTQDPLVTQYINSVQGWHEVNREVNSGAYRITQLKIIASDVTQFSNPLFVFKTSLTDREVTEPEFPIDLFGRDHIQNVVLLDEKAMNDFSGSVHNGIKVIIQPNTQVTFAFTGELFKAGDIFKNNNLLTLNK